MAIDTLNKRLSALDFCMAPWGASMPLPDGSLSIGNLYHLLGLYSGIAEPSEGGTVTDWLVTIARRRRGR